MNGAPQKKASAWETFKAIAWSFFGVRRSKDFQDDQVKLKPYQLIAGGLIGVFIFIGILIAVVNAVVPST